MRGSLFELGGAYELHPCIAQFYHRTIIHSTNQTTKENTKQILPEITQPIFHCQRNENGHFQLKD